VINKGGGKIFLKRILSKDYILSRQGNPIGPTSTMEKEPVRQSVLKKSSPQKEREPCSSLP
jgi:hypothetical protein